MLTLQFLGAAETVTGSRTLVECEGKKILIDCGLFQGPKQIRQKNWQVFEGAKDISAVILTHAHIDHSGLLPLLVKNGFRGKIYSSSATYELCKIMLPDSAKLQEEDADFANRTKYSSHQPALPLYTTLDAERVLELFMPMPYLDWIELTPQLSFRLSRSAHILGSSFVEMNYIENDKIKRLTFSGDLGNNRSLILREMETVTECDYLVLESTYGDRTIPHYDPMKDLGDAIHRTIQRGGTVIIPAFSVGRTQEVLFMIQKLKERGVISDAPVYLDSPMALKATTIYQKFESELKEEIKDDVWRSVSESIKYIPTISPDDSMLLCMDTEAKIVISAAGMLNGGRVLHHLKAKLPDKKSTVIFVGYQVPGTKGYLLRNKLGKIRIHHTLIDVEAEIVNLDSLSAHADSDELVRWVKNFKIKPRRIFLNHGELPSLQALQYRLKSELGMDAVIVKEEEVYQL
jgi:metallo-beta-lactamase family protein